MKQSHETLIDEKEQISVRLSNIFMDILNLIHEMKNGCVENQSAMSVYLDSNQTLPEKNIWNKLKYDIIDYDVLNEFDNSADHKFTAIKDGIYMIQARALFDVKKIGEYIQIQIQKNEERIAYKSWRISAYTTGVDLQLMITEHLMATDFIDVLVMATENDEVIIGGNHITYLMITKLH